MANVPSSTPNYAKTPTDSVSNQLEIEMTPYSSSAVSSTITSSSWMQIDNVKIISRLGEGNFGEVCQGVWNGTTDVALKQLKSTEHFKEFIQEGTLLQSLNHPNVVRFLGFHTSVDH